jgi:outer membrane protein assembly factor BamB
MIQNSKKHIVDASIISLLYLLIILVVPVLAQDTKKTHIKNRHRVDLRDLGYPMVNEIPENSSAITSLMTSSNGKIYGGTSGEEAYLFLFDPMYNKVGHLGRIEGQGGIHHSLVEDKDGYIYIGTGKNMLEKITLSKGETGEYLDEVLWRDIKNHFKDYPGGHLYRYDPKKSDGKVKLTDMACEAEDLGIPLANNSIYALTINPEENEIYGLTYPDGHFFIYSISKRKFKDLGEIDSELVFHGPERHLRSLPRALICDDSGKVFTSSTNGILKYYCPKSGEIYSTDLVIPGDYYYLWTHLDYTVVEYFVKNKSGIIYGGTSDGYLFSFDPENMKLVNLGKPRASRRLRCLTIGFDNKIYMMAGERSSAWPCQFYSYDLQASGYEDLGLLIADRSPYYYWRGFQFDCMTTGLDGTIYLGESERRSHLFIYIP